MNKIKNLENEIWKTIVDLDRNIIYKNMYLISNFGRIKNIKNNKERLTSIYNINGYKSVSIHYNKLNQFNYSVHRLLLFTFKPDEYKKGLLVRHLDDVKTNNTLNNLEWGTDQQNKNDAISNGIFSGISKKIDRYDMNGKFIDTFPSICEADRKLNLGTGNLCNCCSQKYSSARNFRFAYHGKKLHPLKAFTLSKAIIKLDENKKIINIYSSMREAEKRTSISRYNISNVCYSKTKNTGGFYWIFKNKYEEKYGKINESWKYENS